MTRIMITAILCLIFWIFLHMFYFFRREEITDWRKIKKESFLKYLQEFHSKWAILLWIAAFLGMGICYFMAVYYELAYINCIRNALVYAWLLIIAIIDAKEQLIPRFLTTTGFLGWVLLVLVSVWVGGDSFRNIFIFSGSGLLLGGGMFFLCRILSKGGIGMGDIRMFSVIGLLYGMNYTFSILFFTILLMSVFGIIATVSKKKNMKSMIAMGPFTLIAFCICCVLGI